jgi:hypothetical protein
MIRLSRFNGLWWRRLGSSCGRRLVLTLMLFGMTCCCGSLFAQQAKSVTLTDQHLSATTEIDSRTVAVRPAILELDVTELSNPGLVPIGVAVSIVVDDQKIPVGNFAFYPADHKGNFSLDCRAAMSRVSGKGKAQLSLELRKLRASAAWRPVSVTIASPQWRAGKTE